MALRAALQEMRFCETRCSLAYSDCSDDFRATNLAYLMINLDTTCYFVNLCVEIIVLFDLSANDTNS